MMKNRAVLVIAPCLLILFLFVLFKPPSRQHQALFALPADMLWAWERPEDLRWLGPEIGVAYVATTIELNGGKFSIRPRGYHLLVRPETAVVPIVHVDGLLADSTLNEKQIGAIVDQALTVARRGTRKVVQLDFEAKKSQRASLELIVSRIREKLPDDFALSMTALASWCVGDYWLESLPVDEIVPMAFRMARDDRRIRVILDQRGTFPHARCLDAVGFATDEKLVQVVAPRRYHFSPVPWQETAWLAWQKQMKETEKRL